MFEVIDEAGYRAARHVFGALPNEAKLLQFAKSCYYQLSFSQPGQDKMTLAEKVNFKRHQREAHRLGVDNCHQKHA